MPAASKTKVKAETVAPEPGPDETVSEPEAPETTEPETGDENGEGEEGTEASASPLTVTDPEEVALLINARRLRDAAEAHADDPNAPPTVREMQSAPETVMLEDERSQRELDLRVVNQQIMGARQALSAAKLNRLLNAAGLLPQEAKQHDTQFRQDIHEIRQGIDLMIAIKNAMGDTGIDEPPLVALEVPKGDGLASLAK